MPLHKDSNFLTPSPPFVGVVVVVKVAELDEIPSLRTIKISRLFSKFSIMSWAVRDANGITVDLSIFRLSSASISQINVKTTILSHFLFLDKASLSSFKSQLHFFSSTFKRFWPLRLGVEVMCAAGSRKACPIIFPLSLSQKLKSLSLRISVRWDL